MGRAFGPSWSRASGPSSGSFLSSVSGRASKSQTTRCTLAGVLIVDTSFEPILLLRMSGVITLDDVETLQRESTPMLQRLTHERRRSMTVSDSREVSKVDVTVRKAFAEFSNSQDPAIQENVLVSIVITDSVILRAALTAVTWLSPRMRSTRAVSDFEGAADAIRRGCANADVPVPATLDALLLAHGKKGRAAAQSR